MRRILLAVPAIAISAVPRTTLACAVCFGQSDSPMAWGVNMGVFLMLGVTGAVLAGFASFFVYLMRRAKLVADGAPGMANGRYVATASDPQEGTAQC